ncbi:hypothetical protein NL676_026955 [Syzygium grande]|nr:hypothetical protein NL676_026955 [Syzygium grande]
MGDIEDNLSSIAHNYSIASNKHGGLVCNTLLEADGPRLLCIPQRTCLIIFVALSRHFCQFNMVLPLSLKVQIVRIQHAVFIVAPKDHVANTFVKGSSSLERLSHRLLGSRKPTGHDPRAQPWCNPDLPHVLAQASSPVASLLRGHALAQSLISASHVVDQALATIIAIVSLRWVLGCGVWVIDDGGWSSVGDVGSKDWRWPTGDWARAQPRRREASSIEARART